MSYFSWSVPGIPGLKRRGRASSHGGKARVHSDPKTVREESSFLSMSVEHLPTEPLEGPVAVRVVLVYVPPKSFPKWKYEAAVSGAYMRDTGSDLDNGVKMILDALNGVAFLDDRQVYRLAAVKRYGPKPETRVSITSLKQPTKESK